MLPPLPFRAVNLPGAPGYDPGLQRHHVLPLQILAEPCFDRMFDVLGRARVGFDDFRRNGLMLPANSRTAVAMGLPLHRGPHKAYNAIVIERVGQIEDRWFALRRRQPDRAGIEALFRLGLLRKALVRRLLDPRGNKMMLNSRDPAAGQEADFTDLDMMAESLWAEAAPVQDPNVFDLSASSARAEMYSASSLSTRSATDSTAVTAPMPCPEPQISFHALAPVLPPEPKSILLGSLSGRLSGSSPAATMEERR